MDKKVRIALYVIAGIIVIVGLEFLVFRLVSKKSNIPPDPGSTSRMHKLNNVLKSHFGNSWPFTLMFMLVLMLIIFALLYFVLKKETITWNVSDHTGKILSRIGLIFAVLLSLTLVGLGVYAVIKERKNQAKENENSGDFSASNKGTQFLELVGLILALIVIVALIIYGIRHHLKYEKSLKTAMTFS